MKNNLKFPQGTFFQNRPIATEKHKNFGTFGKGQLGTDIIYKKFLKGIF